MILYDDPCVIVGGAPRSGTTLVGAILSQHPRAAILLEERLTNVVLAIERLASVRTQLEDGARSELFGGARSFLNLPLDQGESEIERLSQLSTYRDRFRDLIRSFFSTLTSRHEIGVIGSKLPIEGNWEDISFLVSRFSSLRFVLIVRNPLDVISSSLLRGKNAELGLDEWPIRDVSSALDQWRAAMRVMYDLLAQHPHSVLAVKYEDLCQEPLHWETEIRKFSSLSNLPGSNTLASALPREERPGLSRTDLEFLEADLGKGIDPSWRSLGAEQAIKVYGDPTPVLKPNGAICFAKGLNGELLKSGFSFPEDWGRWTDGTSAAIQFKLADPHNGLTLNLHTIMARIPPQRALIHVRTRVDNQAWKDHYLEPCGVFSVRIPASAIPNKAVILEINIPEPKPATEDPVEDKRRLGIALSKLELMA